MKRLRTTSILLLILTLSFLGAQAQTKEKPIIRYLSKKMEPIKIKETAAFGEAMWQEDSLWHVQIFNMKAQGLQEDFFYKTEERKEKHGPWATYYPNGSMEASCTYIDNKRSGIYKHWQTNGTLDSLFHFHNGLPVDSGFGFIKTEAGRKISYIQHTDSSGNGTGKCYYPDGTLKGSGAVLEGTKTGKWEFLEKNGDKIMAVTYHKDSIVATDCFGTTNSPCIFQKKAEFKGGKDGWNRYIERNLRYPEEAVAARISGVVTVKFLIDEQGVPAEAEILSSPHDSLTKEVLRIIQSSHWTPAIELNKPVKAYFSQSVTFKSQ